MWAESDPWVSISHGDESWSWRLSTLWKLSEGLPVMEKSLADLGCEHWTFFINGRSVPTCELPADYRRISAANLDYPILFSAQGTLLDGRHRVVRAWRQGLPVIRCVQFVTDPLPELVRKCNPPKTGWKAG